MQKVTQESGKISRLFNSLAYEITLCLHGAIEQFSYKVLYRFGKLKMSTGIVLCYSLECRSRLGLVYYLTAVPIIQ